MSLEFGVAEILQRTKDERIRPVLQFDTAQWIQLSHCVQAAGSQTGVVAAGTNVLRLTIPRPGLYQIWAQASWTVLAAARRLEFLAQSVDGSQLFAFELSFTANAPREMFNLGTFYCRDGDILDWTLRTAMVAGDELHMNTNAFEIVV